MALKNCPAFKAEIAKGFSKSILGVNPSSRLINGNKNTLARTWESTRPPKYSPNNRKNSIFGFIDKGCWGEESMRGFAGFLVILQR